MKTGTAVIGGVALGAAVNYFADSKLGKRRRAIARDSALHLKNVFRRAVDLSIRDSRNRLLGVVEETKKFKGHPVVGDHVLEDRVRTAVGRVCSHPNVEVIVEEGRVMLFGPVVDREEHLVITAAKSVEGIAAVENRMKPYKPLAFMPTQQPKIKQPLNILQAHWAPATRVVAGMIGGLLIILGGRRKNTLGTGLVRLMGSALLARSTTNMGFKHLLRLG